MKYKYIGDVPVVLIDLHIEVKPGDVIDVNAALDSPLFVSQDKPAKGVDQ